MDIHKKIKAGALQYVLIISIIIAIILLGFILYINVQQKVTLKNKFFKEAIINVANGFAYQSQKSIPLNQKITQNFSNNLQERTTLMRKSWGIFDLAFTASKVKKEYFSKVALMGWKTRKSKALYLKDNNTPLVVVGQTKIVGDVFLPTQGIKTGNIAGNSFNGSELFLGREFKSKSSLPILQNKHLISRWSNADFFSGDHTFFDLKDGMKLTNSFTAPTLVQSNDLGLVLSNIELTGNIVISSKSKIVIERSSKLKDLILIAPEIIIRRGVEGNFQCFASKNIIVNENCSLSYPSALILLSKVSDKDNSIEIKQNTAITGCIVYDYENKVLRSFYTPQIRISDNVTISGEVYCNGNIELLGTVKGTVFTSNFVTNQYGSTYVNHIYNGKILYNQLHEKFSGLNIDAKNSRVIKWLY